MLRNLSIRNFAIIDRLDLAFEPGLNVLTGETGAGKSIIIGALNLILGGRAGAEMVRSGADRATVDAVFDISGSPELASILEEQGFESEEGSLYLSREIGAAGKSAARVAGRPAAVAQLKEIGGWLVDLHGQHEHQSLLSVPRHAEILDEWGGGELLEAREAAGTSWESLRALERERDSLESDARERVRLIDLYAFQVNEIQAAGLQAGEEEELRADARRLANAQKLAEAAAMGVAALSEGGGALEQIAEAAAGLDSAAGLDDALIPIAEAVRCARFELEEAARDLARYQERIEFNPQRLEQVEERLDLIQALKRKYGDTIEEVLDYAARTGDSLEAFEHSEERGQELDQAISEARERSAAMCARLTALRRTASADFSTAVKSELGDLAMEKTRFEAQIEPAEPGPRGADRIEFLISPNPGEPLRPLARIASGGEISRVMLAIKSAMARQDPLPTMVFDEVDAGVGGRTASVLGDKMRSLAACAQIICITHLPQIASRAAHHLYIEKRADGSRTEVTVEPLTPGDRVQELARMLGGAAVTEAALQHAREMLAAP